MKHPALTPIRILAMVFLLGAAGATRADLVLALKPDKDPDAMLEERRLIGQKLAAHFGHPVQVIVPLSGSVILEGLANGTIDLAWVSAMDMLKIRTHKAGEMLLAGTRDGKTGYPSCWVVAVDSPAASVADLAGQPVAFSSRTSTSGYLIPLLDLHRRGLLGDKAGPGEFFGPGNVWFGTGYVSAVERVLSGDAVAAAVSGYVIDEDRHLTPEQKRHLRVLQTQGPVPTHVLAASSRLAPEERARLAEKLLAFDATGLRKEVDLFANPLVVVDPDLHLEPVRSALEQTAAAP